MFTPQEIQEKTFVKAVFGGYDMQTVDEFLEPLTEDYITLYKENAVLKSKMKVLVEKLEEYRSQEESMRKAIISAQRTADAMVAEAEKKCARLMSEAENTAQSKTVNVEQALSEEEERINCAKQAALNFIDVIEKDIKGHLDLLESLKHRDLRQEHSAPAPQRQKPFDYEEAENPLVVPKSQPTPPPAPRQTPERTETAEDIASEIEQNISRIMDMADPVQPMPAAPRAAHPESSTIKFTNLQFGRNYDPTSGR